MPAGEKREEYAQLNGGDGHDAPYSDGEHYGLGVVP